jgi:hypothetical protein
MAQSILLQGKGLHDCYTLWNHALYIYYGQEKLTPLGNCSKLGFQPVGTSCVAAY